MAAVEVRNGFKYYGSSSDPNKKIVLNYLNMTVTRGTIYGLLGASGCGKTTLLSCIVGQRQLNSGEINVFGENPGRPGTGIPGPRLGYMPQEIALVREMTVQATIYYFGRIYGLNDDKIRERYKILKDLLELPPSKQIIEKCSGGQQRRVSFACALVHEPELLILDEPTVGLDPILRERIWDFLVDSTKNSMLAVIITTHYIEEAKQANCIGLMRNGILLAQDSPDNIIRHFECRSIEDAFLILCQRQGKSEEANKSLPPRDEQDISSVEIIRSNATQSAHTDREKSLLDENQNPPDRKRSVFFTSRARMKALMAKNVVQLTTRISSLVFMFAFPLLQVSSFYLAVGGDPKELTIGIVNYEVKDHTLCYNDSLVTVLTQEYTCEFNKISCRYLQEIDGVAHEIYYANSEEAYAAALRTDIVGYIEIADNFSESTQKFLEDARLIENSTYLSSVVNVWMDMSDYQIGHFLQKKLRDAHQRFLEGLMLDCNLPQKLAHSPLRFEDPVYGTFTTEFQRFVTPGVVLTMIFFLSTLVTTSVFITERSDGVWDRTLVAGISTTEMLIAHTISQSTIMIFQCLEVIIYISMVFNIENHGSNVAITALLILNGFAGMLFGLVISIYCKTHTLSNFVATGAFYPMIILCGILWPLEGMPVLLQYIALTFPFTIPSLAARNILEKGWSINNSQVYNGFLVVILWIIIFFIVSIVGLKRKT